jgi:hypothetical protein
VITLLRDDRLLGEAATAAGTLASVLLGLLVGRQY